MNVAITGIGTVSPIGIGGTAFSQALKAGKTNFSQIEFAHQEKTFVFPSALATNFNYKRELAQLDLPTDLVKKASRMRNISTSSKLGIYAALEAWCEGKGIEKPVSANKIALVVSGNNFQQATIQQTQERYSAKLNFLNPTYAFNFLDTDLVGCLSQLLGIKGEGYSIGAASASGNMALIQGCRLIASGEYEQVLVVAPSMELSIYEYQGFTALGAMASLKSEKQPLDSFCNPFDKTHAGFVYGQNAGAILLESKESAAERNMSILANIIGYGTALDSNRNPNPSAKGEARAMQLALKKAGLDIEQIDYINTHGTASPTGDKTELEAITSIGGTGIKANATKGLIGHGITSAGLVEAIACVIQMNENYLHPNPNLKQPTSDVLTWIKKEALTANTDTCMSNSFGFGGINTSIILSK